MSNKNMNESKYTRGKTKLDLCEGGSFSTVIFNSDIQLSVFPISCLICLSVCHFVKGNVCRKFAHCSD